MSKKNRVFLIILVGINVVYFSFLLMNSFFSRSQGSLPVISFDSEMLVLSVDSDEAVLLSGVHAYDAEDGDLSDQVFIYSLSPFDENQTRTVTYGVFDSDNQMTTASIQLAYTNYTKPYFSSKQPLTGINLSSLSGSGSKGNSMRAYSCVDGDITNKISMNQMEKDGKIIYQYSVSDSTGSSRELEISEDLSLKGLMMNVTIELSDYLIYVNPGSYVDYRSYLMNVKTSLGIQNELLNSVQIETNYDPYTSGVYEVKYSLSRLNGDYGSVSMFIVVEEGHGE